MAANALKKINAEAKRLRNAHPTRSYKSCQKEAGRKYKAGKISGVKKKSPARKKAMGKRRKRVGGPKVSKVHNVQHYGTIGSLAGHKRAVRTLLDDKLSKKLLQIEKAPNKTKRKKLLKQKAVIKKELSAFR
jgi:hypothetical protein